MTKLSATLSLVDGFSSKLDKINNNLAQSGKKMNAFKRVVSALDPSMFDSAAKSSNNLFKSMLGSNIVKQGLGAISRGAQSLIGDLSEAGATWQTFQGNMEMLDKSPKAIANTKKELQDFATQTIYSASDMASTYSQLEAAGIKSADKLTMGFGGLAAAAANPQQAMAALSQQAAQMAAKPMVQWQDFKLMLEQTPAGVAAVARSMGKSTSELINDVQAGTLKTQDLFNAITATGTNAKFTEMATQFKTVGQAMDGFKEGLMNKLQPTFDKVSQYGIKALEKLSGYVDKINFDKIGDNFIRFIDAAIKGVQIFWDGFKNSGAIASVSSAFSAIGQAIGHVTSVLSGGAGNGIQSLGEAIGGITKKAANIIESVANAIAKMSPGQINSVVGALKSAAVAMFGFKTASAAFKKGLAVYQGVSGTINTVKKLGSVLKGLSPSKSPAAPVLPQVPAVSGAKEGLSPSKSPAAPVLPQAPSISGAKAGWMNAAKTATILLGVAVSIKIVASAFEDIASVNTSWGQLGKNLAQMGIFLLAAAVAMGIVGGAIKLFPPIAAALAIGAGVFIGIAATMVLVGKGLASFAKSSATAIQAVNQTKLDKNFAGKLVGIFGALTGLSAVGAFTGMLGLISAPFAVLGSISFSLITATITKVANFANELKSMSLPDAGSMDPKLKQVQTIANKLATFKIGKIGNIGAIFSSAFASLATNNIINTFKKVADFVQQISTMPNISGSTLEDKFKALTDIKSSLEKAAQNASGTNNIGAAFNSWFGNMDTGNIISSFTKVADLVTKISSMKTIDTTSLDGKFKTIKDVFEKLKKFSDEKFNTSFIDSLKSMFGKMDTSNLVDSFNKVADLTGKISTLKTVDSGTIDAKFNTIKQVFTKLKDFEIDAYAGNINNIDSYQKIIDSIKKVSSFISDIAGAKIVDISAKIEQIKKTLNNLSNFDVTEPKNKDLGKKLDSIKKIVTPLSDIATSLGTIASIPDLTSVGTKITQIGTAADSAGKLKISTPSDELSDAINKLKPLISNLTAIAQNLKTLNGITISAETVGNTIEAIKKVINSIVEKITTEALGKVSGLQTGIDTTKSAIDSLKKMVNTMNTIPTVATTLSTNVTAIQNALDSLGTLKFNADLSTKASQMSEAINTLISTMKEMTSKFNPIGDEYANAVGSGFSSGMNSTQETVDTAMSGMVNSILNTARNGAGEFESVGSMIGQGLASGLRSAYDAVASAASDLIEKANEAARAKAQIHSPSRLFRDEVGWYLGAGVATGIDNSTGLVSDSSIGMINTALTNSDIPGQSLAQSTVSNQTTNHQTKQVSFNFGDIVLQRTGDDDKDIDTFIEKLEARLEQLDNASLAF